MPHFLATELATGAVTEYDAATPQSEHLGVGWRCEEIIVAIPSPDEPQPEPTMFGGRRDLTKQEFYDLLGADARQAILTMAKQEVAIEDWLKRFEILTPYLNNYSVNLDYADTVIGVWSLEPILISLGVVQAGWAEGVLRG